MLNEKWLRKFVELANIRLSKLARLGMYALDNCQVIHDKYGISWEENRVYKRVSLQSVENLTNFVELVSTGKITVSNFNVKGRMLEELLAALYECDKDFAADTITFDDIRNYLFNLAFDSDL